MRGRVQAPCHMDVICAEATLMVHEKILPEKGNPRM